MVLVLLIVDGRVAADEVFVAAAGVDTYVVRSAPC